MEEQNSEERLIPNSQSKKDNEQKKTVGQLFGIQLSAPKGMKNPMTIFLALIVGNLLLLVLVGKALGLF